jgi:hypothetical protein
VPIIDQAFSELRTARGGKRNTNSLKWARQLHLWLGVLFAPAIIFFAFSGALQTFSFHESEPGSTYQPPIWIQKLAQLHKKQTIQVRPKRQDAPGLAKPESPIRRGESETSKPPVQQPLSTTLMKWFAFALSLGLITTSLLGIYMAFQYNRSRRVIWILLALGTIMPVLLIR